MQPIRKAAVVHAITNRIESAALLVRAWPFARTPTADRLLQDRRFPAVTWLQHTLAGA